METSKSIQQQAPRSTQPFCMYAKNIYQNLDQFTNVRVGLVTVEYNGFLYIFGGFNKNKDLHFQDLNRYDPKSSTWMTILPKGTSPCARRRQICQVVNNRVFISGGTSPLFPKPLMPLRLRDYDLDGEESTQLKDHDDLHVLDLSKIFKFNYLPLRIYVIV